MKKILALLLALVLLTSMSVGCSRTEESPASDFEYLEKESCLLITKYIGTSEHVVIPEKINDLPVTGIGPLAFASKQTIKTVSMPDAVGYIGWSAFSNCTNLKKIRFSDTIYTIESHAFRNCTSLKEAKLPKKLETLGGEAFLGCTSLTSVTIPKTLTNWGDYTFMNNSSLRSITFEDGLKKIGARCFDSASLTKVTIPASINEIGELAFVTPNLKKVTFKGNAPSKVGGAAFGDLTENLTIYYRFYTSGWDETRLNQYTLKWTIF